MGLTISMVAIQPCGQSHPAVNPSVERKLTTAASTVSAAPLDAKMEQQVLQSASSSSSSFFTPILQPATCPFLPSPHQHLRFSARHWAHSHVIASPD
jgi:hypothetical protein